MPNMSEEVSWFARQYIDYVYVPGFLLILGTAIVKWDWLVFAVPLALVLGGYNVWSFRKVFFFFVLPAFRSMRSLLSVVATCSLAVFSRKQRMHDLSR